jgi:NAD(P)-dependent dehydrogenase (short-subunit alcohol dehydrogenase family)
MENKVFVVTGVTSGVGRALATEIARTGEMLVMIARDPDRGSAALKEIALATQNPNLDMQLCDLSILSSVRNVAEILKSKYEKIDVLINSAGLYRRTRRVTVDGFEEMFAANYLGPFLLTNLLLERLQAAVQADGSARVLNITAPSTVPLNFEDLQGERNFNSLNTFGATKMANLLFTFALARKLESTGITVNAVHPGVARSGLMREAFAPLRFFTWLISGSPKKAAENIRPLALAPDFEKITGKFFYRGKETDAPAYAYDRAVQQRLWEASEVFTDLAATKGELPITDPQF